MDYKTAPDSSSTRWWIDSDWTVPFFSRRAWGGLRSFRWAGCKPRDASHPGGSGGGRRSVHLCGQQPCWNLCRHCQSGGWRWAHTPVFHVKLIFLTKYTQRKIHPSPHSGPIVLWGTGRHDSQRWGEYHPPLRCPGFPAADSDLAQTGRQTDSYEDRQPQSNNAAGKWTSSNPEWVLQKNTISATKSFSLQCSLIQPRGCLALNGMAKNFLSDY